MTELKPCPFCGSEAVPRMIYPVLFVKGAVTVMCDNCGGAMILTGNKDCLEYAIEAWNRRTPNETD